jgi:hypothetical protein
LGLAADTCERYQTSLAEYKLQENESAGCPKTELDCTVANVLPCGDNREVQPKLTNSQREGNDLKTDDPFLPGAIVIVTLCSPREKFWGMILALAPEGLSLSGIELASFEDLAVMVKDGEPFTPAVVFFPMHRVERVDLDMPDGNLPSLSQRFLAKTGLRPSTSLSPPDVTRLEGAAASPNAGDEPA